MSQFKKKCVPQIAQINADEYKESAYIGEIGGINSK